MNVNFNFRQQPNLDNDSLLTDACNRKEAVVKSEILPQYREYLKLLHERNSLLKHLCKKDQQQVIQERKEKGFSIYINGANSGVSKHRSTTIRKLSPIAVTDFCTDISKWNFERRSGSMSATDAVLKKGGTSPVSEGRRRWNVSYSNARQEKNLPAPGTVFRRLDETLAVDSQVESHTPDFAVDQSSLCCRPTHAGRRCKGSRYLRRRAALNEPRSIVLTVDQVHELRQSLQRESSVRQSVSLDITSDESEDERCSDESIEEELVSSVMQSFSLDDDPGVVLSPQESVVLEFCPISDKIGHPSSSPAAVHRHNIQPQSADKEDEAAAVMRAVAWENMGVESMPESGVQPTSVSQGPVWPGENQPKKSTSPISTAIDLFLSMAPRQQRELLRTLSSIDDSMVDTERLMTTNSYDGQKDITTSASSHLVGKQVSDCELRLKILSNWGNCFRVGLTEVQVIQYSGLLVPVSSSSVRVFGAESPSADALVLFNGKTKTTKLRHMWSCQRWSKQPVVLCLTLPHNQISALRLWNWNSGIKDLDIGVKDLRVSVDGVMVFEGQLDKGCGNNVFDYSCTIPLHTPPSDCQQSASFVEETPLSISTVDDDPTDMESVIPEHFPHHLSCGAVSVKGEHSDVTVDICSLLDEELAAFSSSAGQDVDQLTKCGSASMEPSAEGKEVSGREEEEAVILRQKRRKWKTADEDTWSRLSYFDQSHRGRLSVDMTENLIEECLQNSFQEELFPLRRKDGDFTDRLVSCVIPELPTGMDLVLNIHSTWGDRHYVGLTAIQLFSTSGHLISIKKPLSQIHANPSDINVLPEYGNDPRVVENLVDCVNRTCDDTHMWLAPFTPGNDHFIYLSLSQSYTIALIRIWNYNKSRIHSYRGAKDVSITLDGSLIFSGEIVRACGSTVGGTEVFGDTILFTTDEGILEAISRNDDAFSEEELCGQDMKPSFVRPNTADSHLVCVEDMPFEGKLLEKEMVADSSQNLFGSRLEYHDGDVVLYKVNTLRLNMTATWGDKHYMGLTGLEVIGQDGERIPLTMDMLSACPESIQHLPGHEHDHQTLGKLIDGRVVTVSDQHMWLIPFTNGQDHVVNAVFQTETFVSGLRLWNYNRSEEDAHCGVRVMHVSINGLTVSPPAGFLIRRAPGNCHFDFVQEIIFSQSYDDKKDSRTSPKAFPSQIPCGFIYQFQLFSTWGDPFYIGLNGIELFGGSLQKIHLTESNIAAYPESVNALGWGKDDVRTPDKLVDGHNDSMDGHHSWLAPVLPGLFNRVYVVFDEPTDVSMIKIWNYAKTPLRGVKDIAVLVDDFLLYNGTVSMVEGVLATCPGPPPYHTVLFASNAMSIHHEHDTGHSNPTWHLQDVHMSDMRNVTHNPKSKLATNKRFINQGGRPDTGVTDTSVQWK